MNYFSAFDGIGAIHTAWQSLGFQCVGISEINEYCNQLIERKYGFKNYGNFKNWKDWGQLGADVIVASPPCVAFSGLGRRAGTDDPAGALSPDTVRFICSQRPRWFVLENVPEILSTNQGRLFRWTLYKFSECGYCVSWRILNAKSFGVPQSRRRVFIVGSFGNGYDSSKVLFDGETMPIFAPKISGKTQADSRTIENDIRKDRYRGNRQFVGTLISSPGGGIERLGSVIVDNGRARWLTPLERERLMGFPGGHTKDFSDTQRHRQTGNSIVVPILKWIGQRILMVEQESTERIKLAG